MLSGVGDELFLSRSSDLIKEFSIVLATMLAPDFAIYCAANSFSVLIEFLYWFKETCVMVIPRVVNMIIRIKTVTKVAPSSSLKKPLFFSFPTTFWRKNSYFIVNYTIIHK